MYIYIYNSIYIHIIYTINPNVKPVKLEFTKLPCHYLAILYLVYLDQTVANRDAGAHSTSALIVSATLGAGPHRGWSGDKVWKKQICVDFFFWIKVGRIWRIWRIITISWVLVGYRSTGFQTNGSSPFSFTTRMTKVSTCYTKNDEQSD